MIQAGLTEMMFSSKQITDLKEYGFSMGSKAYIYREMGATDEQVKRFVVNALPMGLVGNEWATDIYMKAARVGFCDKGQKYNHPVYDLMKTAMKGIVNKWQQGQYHTFRTL